LKGEKERRKYRWRAHRGRRKRKKLSTPLNRSQGHHSSVVGGERKGSLTQTAHDKGKKKDLCKYEGKDWNWD